MQDLGMNTVWDDQLSYLLTPSLAAYETERVTGNINTYSAELICFELFDKKEKPEYCYLKIVITIARNNVADRAGQDQTARYVQSDLDLHCPQKQLNLVPAL